MDDSINSSFSNVNLLNTNSTIDMGFRQEILNTTDQQTSTVNNNNSPSTNRKAKIDFLLNNTPNNVSILDNFLEKCPSHKNQANTINTMDLFTHNFRLTITKLRDVDTYIGQ